MKIKYILKYMEYLLKHVKYYFVSNKKYREKRYLIDFQCPPNYKSPESFNEKIMWRMLAGKNKLFIQMADKVKARDRVRELVGEKYLVNVLHRYKNVSDINFNVLPEKFVLKCNHDCGSVVICKRNEGLDINFIRSKLRFFMNRNQYYDSREWQYRDIKPEIICEEYVELSDAGIPEYRAEMYRIHCFKGKAVWLEVEYTDAIGERYSCIYDTSWTLLPVIMRYPNTDIPIPAPIKLPELLDVAGKLTLDIDYCRVDFYVTFEKILFSEFTFSPANGREIFTPRSWDYIFGLPWDINHHNEK